MAIHYDEYNRVGVLTPGGDLSADDAAELRKLVGESAEGRRLADFVVDLSAARFIDSAGLEALLWARRRCEGRLGRVKLAGLDPNCRKILEITRAALRFECHPDLQSALRSMNG